MFGVGALIWFVSAWLPTAWAYILWGVGIAIVLYAPISRQSRQLADRYPIDFEHLGERYGLLTVIVLAELFVEVLSYLTASDVGTEFSYLTKASLSLLVTCSVWWIYFDDVAGSELKEGRGNWIIWLFGHLPLAVAITALGVAVKKIVTFDLWQPPEDAYRWLACAALALVFFSVAIIDSVSERQAN